MHRHFNGKAKPGRIAAHIVLAIGIVTVVCLGFGYAVMLLWNGVLPDLLGVRTIGYWQAVGLLVLCRLLVGGLHPFRRNRPHRIGKDPGHDAALDEFVDRGR